MAKLKTKESAGNLSASLEDYLETIAVLKREKKYARVSEIAKSLNVKNSSVNIAINLLAENGFVVHEKYGYVDLTLQGEKMAGEVQRKHNILNEFLTKLLFIDNKIAGKEACAIEHLVGSETIHRLERLHKLLKKYFFTKDEDFANFKEYLKKGKDEKY